MSTLEIERSASDVDAATGTAPDDRSVELTVVMPCLNEELTVGVCVAKAVQTMQRLGIVGEVVIVDNGSTDRSIELAEQAGARVVRHDLKGYGNALRRGFQEARGRYIIMGDSDDSYDFTDLGRFVDRLRGGAELVMGNRLKGEIKPGAMPWHHRWIGNPVLSWFLNVLFNTGVGDSHCGMRGFTREGIQRIGLKMPGMELASEMVIKASQGGLRIEEIPIVLHPDGRDRPPHLRSFRDGWRHLRFMLMCAPAYLFVLPGLLFTFAGIAAPPLSLLAGHGAYSGSFGPNFLFATALLSIVGLNLMFFGILAKMYTQQVDPVFTDDRLNRTLRWFTVERGLWCGILLMLAGMGLAVPVLYELATTRLVTSPAAWILAATLVTLGVETLFGSFLVGILQLPQESRRHG